MQKGFAPIFILIGILLISGVAGGVYYLKFRKTESFEERLSRQNPVLSPSISPQQNNKPTPDIPQNDETANWKTYENSKLSYQISYPESSQYQVQFPGRKQITEYNPDSNQPSLLGITNIDLLSDSASLTAVWISVWKNLGIKVVDTLLRDEWCKKIQLELIGQQECHYKLEVQETRFNRLKAFKVSGGRDNSFVTTYYIPYAEFIYQIAVGRPMNDLDNPLPAKVLETFKFLDSESIEEKSCGGFAGETGDRACPEGYYCKYPQPAYPDASGKCVKK